MKISEKLYFAVKDIWESYNVHPFVCGVGNGTLDKEKFKFYLIQDYLYLLDYSKVFALGMVKAKDEDVMRLFSKLAYGTLDHEMSTHKAYMERFGVTQSDIKLAEVSLPNHSYTKYMLAVGQNEGVAEIAVAVLACAWSYKCIGDHLEKIEGSKDHEFYGEWVSAYTSDEYRESNTTIIELVDRLTKDYTDEQIKNLEEIIINCSRYEYMFWDMAWNKEM